MNSVVRRIHFDRHPGQHLLLPEGMFRVANPDAIRLGSPHLVSYNPFDQFVQIVAVDAPPAPTLPQIEEWLRDHPNDQPIS